MHLLPKNVCPVKEGAIVETTGLTSNAKLNGMIGTVVDTDDKTCRYIVRLQALEHHGPLEKAVSATHVFARTRLWDLDVASAPTCLQ